MADERVPLKKPTKIGVQVIKANTSAVAKAETATQISAEENRNAGEWISKPQDFRGLENLVEGSSILPQCIRAYKSNIAGFGIGVRYKEDNKETPEMAAEYERAEKILDLLNTDQDTKEVFEDIIEARETYGVAYVEVIRTLAGDVEQIEFIRDTASVDKTKPLLPYTTTTFFYNGEAVERQKKFCKYRQTVGGKTVYFKEFGDPRIMDNRSGDYLEEGGTLESQYHANEIIEFAIGTKPYGRVRWIGQVLGVDGSRSAEQLNNNYFKNGRHTPLMIIVKGGTLSDDSFAKLQGYMDDIKGENGQHAFLLLETESTDGRTDFEQQERPDIEIKDLASVLQKDELFQEYLENNRRRVQSAFQLPDLYTGYTTDFNRATAQTAMEVTEKQVFQPERISLAWAINNKLLNGYNFKYVEVYFRAPDITNPDDLAKMLGVVNAAGGLTPNKAKDILFKALGETSEDYEEEWGNTPLAYAKTQGASQTPAPSSEVMAQFEKQLRKAAAHNDAEIVAVMKAVKDILESDLTKPPDETIMKYREDQAREDNGTFADEGKGYAIEGKNKGKFGNGLKGKGKSGKMPDGTTYAYYPTTLGGVTRGEPMTFEEADNRAANPGYKRGTGTAKNCQSCVVAHEARMRGYDVEALSKTGNAFAEQLSRDSTLAYCDPKVSGYKYATYEHLDRSIMTGARGCEEALDAVVKEGCRYQFSFKWNGANSAHVICADRNSKGELRFYDPQTGHTYDKDWSRRELLSGIDYKDKFNTPNLLRVDNLAFREEFANGVLKEVRDGWKRKPKE